MAKEVQAPIPILRIQRHTKNILIDCLQHDQHDKRQKQLLRKVEILTLASETHENVSISLRKLY